jgi:Flp pilus assembly pilin Flp
MRRRWRRNSELSDERGVAMAEYISILAAIGAVVFFSHSYLGPWIADHLGVTALSIHYGDYVAGECPEGGYALTNTDELDISKKGPDPNKNGDTYLCDKIVNGEPGNGNTNQNQNLKDNNKLPWDSGG